MKINLPCEYANHDSRMRIVCKKTGNLCAFQYYRRCKGWCEMTAGAAGCIVRKEKK